MVSAARQRWSPWAPLLAVAVGLLAGGVYRVHRIERAAERLIARAGQRSAEATYAGDLEARDLLSRLARSRLHRRHDLDLAALGAAQLFSDHGEDNVEESQALLERAEQERPSAWWSTLGGLFRSPVAAGADQATPQQTRTLLELGRGEACSRREALGGVLRARCERRRGDYSAARAALDAELGLRGTDLRALVERANLAADEGDLDKAAELYRRITDLRPGHPRALVGLALVAYEQGRKMHLPATPPRLGGTEGAWWRLALGLGALAQGDGKNAEHHLRLAGTPRDGRLIARLGSALLDLGHVAEAESRAKLAETRLASSEPLLSMLQAELALRRGQEGQVASDWAGRAGPVRLLAIRGRAEQLVGKSAAAVATLEAVLRQRSDDAVAATYLALAKARTSSPAMAEAALKRLVVERSASTVPHLGLGLLAYERHDLAMARVELARATRGNPEAFRATFWLAKVDRELGRTADAVGELESLAREGSVAPAVQLQLGHLYHALGRDREARASFERGLTQASSEDRLAYAEATLALGQVAEAERLLAAAVDGPPERLARAQLILESWRGAKAARRAAGALEALSRKATTPVAAAALLLDCGAAWLRGGNGRQAAAAYRRAASGPDRFHAKLGLGQALLRTREWAAAEVALRGALALWEGGAFGAEDRQVARDGLERALAAQKKARSR